MALAAGRTTRLAISLALPVSRQQITVEGEGATVASTDASANASAIVLRADELAAFSDDPDELANELQALAGPAAGPNGGQLYVDGFQAGRLPPKASIREIRISQNPLSAEYDRLGFGRIEVLTKPGGDKLRSESFFEFGDAALNTRNPFAPGHPGSQVRLYGGNLGGPINRRASFFVDLERREIDDVAVVHATVLDPSLQPVLLNQAVSTPDRRTSASPRVDYQLSPGNILTGRYRFTRLAQGNAGVNTLSLASRAYDHALDEHVAQLSDTVVLSARALNETRFQFTRTGNGLAGGNGLPALDVLGAFNGGGAQVGNSTNTQNRWELQNNSNFMAGRHSLRFGARLRDVRITDVSPQNFGGSFTFSGGTFGPLLDAAGNVVAGEAPVPTDSLERYRRTLLLAGLGFAPERIRELGGGASLFTVSAGNPLARVSQTDLGAFLQDDWRLRPNLTLNLGFRYETQTNLGDRGDFGPRLGFAWAPGRDPKKRLTVVRGGFGMFYQRFGESLTLQTLRFDGLNQQQFVISNPDFFPNVPPPGALTAGRTPVATWRTARDARAPYLMQGVVSLERQLPWQTKVATTLTLTRGEHLLLARNINAPLAGSGTRPLGAADIFQYESTGILRMFS